MSDLYLRTSIRPDMEKKMLVKSCKIAGAACALIACSEYLLPLLEFESLGLWSWLLGGSAAGLGIIPYGKVKSYKRNPDILQVNEQNVLLIQDGKATFNLSWQHVESFYHLDKGCDYGLAFTLKQPVTTLPRSLTQKSRKEHGVDLFLPYFSHGSYLLLENWYAQTRL